MPGEVKELVSGGRRAAEGGRTVLGEGRFFLVGRGEGLYAVFKELRIREESGLVTRDTIGSEEGGRVISGLSWKLEGPDLVGEGREERG